MNLIKTLLGRRQFLIATGLASGCALTCKKLSDFEISTAMAADKTVASRIKAMGNKCPHLLSPLRIRNTVLKNRIMHTNSPPHCMQGPENFPADAYRNHYSNMAKNAAIISLDMCFGTYPRTYRDTSDPSSDIQAGTQHHSDSIWQDIPPVRNYINRMIDDIHCEGALVRYVGSAGGGGGVPGGEGAPAGGGGQGGMPNSGMQQGGEQNGRDGGGGMPGGGGGMPGGGGGMPGGAGPQTSVSIEDLVAEAKEIEDMGYDVMTINTTDVKAVQAVRSATNLILMASIKTVSSGFPVGGMGGMTTSVRYNYTGVELDWQYGENTPGITNVNHPTDSEIEEVVEAAKQLEGLADFVWIRDGRHEHPNDWTQDTEKPFNLYYAEAIKNAGVNILVCPSAGFHDAAQNDEFIAGGMTDMVGMTTPFFADPELVKKASEGKLDDILPCIQCHCCHGISRTHGPWYDTCTVNPKWATPEYKIKNIPVPTSKKKVAVIGGGPAGMKAAITAAERGHKVTLYERDNALGGLLQFTDYTQWKWNYRKFKDYLAYQVKKQGVDVKLKTSATPKMIKIKGYDTILVATGAEPAVTKMPGADGSNVFNILSCYSNKKSLGKKVVVIGAGRIGTETAMGLAKDGHKVMILCSGKELIELEFIGPHNMMNQLGIVQNHPNLDFVLQATAKKIEEGKVTYTDSEGNQKSIEADSVVIYAGLKPMMDEAEKFIGSANQVLLMGDCTGKNGTIQKAIRSAFFMTSQV